MITVYVWMPGKTHETRSNHLIPGHVAMQVGQEYCSFWPTRDKKNGKENLGIIRPSPADFSNNSYAQDFEGMEYEADDEVDINGLDEQSMIRGWNLIKQQSTNYQLDRVNCCTVSANLLKVGLTNTELGRQLMAQNGNPVLKGEISSASIDRSDALAVTPTRILCIAYLIENIVEGRNYTERQIMDMVKQKHLDAHPAQRDLGVLGAWFKGLLG